MPYLASALELARERVIKAQEEEARALALCGATTTEELPDRLRDCCAETDRLCSEYASLVRQWWLSMRTEAKIQLLGRGSTTIPPTRRARNVV